MRTEADIQELWRVIRMQTVERAESSGDGGDRVVVARFPIFRSMNTLKYVTEIYYL